MVFDGMLLLTLINHTQLQLVKGRPFLLSSLIIECFTMVKLETPVRCVGDNNFIRLQEILQMNHSKYSDDILTESHDLLQTVPTYVENWDSS